MRDLATCAFVMYFTAVANQAHKVPVQVAHGKAVINRVASASNLMYTQSTIYLVDWGNATLQQSALYEGTIHYASIRVLQQLTQGLGKV